MAKVGEHAPVERVAIGIDEVGAALGVSRSTVLKIIADGALDSFKLGKRVLIPRTSVDRLTETGWQRSKQLAAAE